MKRTVIAILLCLQYAVAMAQIGVWTNYLSYNEPQQIEESGDLLFVRASNSLYQYNKIDQSITTYDKTKGLNDTFITLIKWCPKAARLIIIYDNSNIDLLTANGSVINLNDIYSKSITTGSKTINSVMVSGSYAYLACGFGIVKLNVSNTEVSESYILGENVTNITIENNSLYARYADGTVVSGSLADNLINTSNWHIATNAPSFEEDNNSYEKNIELVRTLNPGGPKYNYFYEMTYANGRLYTTAGLYNSFDDTHYPGIIQEYKSKEDSWLTYQEDVESITGYRYIDQNCLAVDPRDANHVFVAGRTGLYEFQKGLLLNYYNEENSPLRSAYAGGRTLGNTYLIIRALKYDSQGNLYVFVNHSNEVTLFRLNTDNTWDDLNDDKFYHVNDGVGMHGIRNMVMDPARGLLWLCNEDWRSTCFLAYDIVNKKVYKHQVLSNQDGIMYNIKTFHCLDLDKEGNVWVGTSEGLFYLSKDDIFDEDAPLQQVKVPRNDGTDYADYLLSSMEIKSIAIDGGNRKWVGTDNGLYLVSADNMTQLLHFQTSNSPLLSDHIFSLAIDGQTGRVYIATDKGLCAYNSDATSASDNMENSSVYAYPNPVTPDYTGLITVVGLSYNADVKILSSSGALIAEGRSNGGTFTWDGCDRKGRRVASGVYMVAVATSDGKKGAVCKIAVVK